MGSDTDSPRTARDWFLALCDLDAERRSSALEGLQDPALRREVEALLEADARTSTPLDGTPPDVVAGGPALPAALQRVADFVLVRELGRGGMGVVYEALQDEPRRSVALKLLHPGLLDGERLRRFQQEAQVLAWLNHPGIARVFAAGTAETPSGPQPYLALELVDGLPIDAFVRTRSASVREILELLAQLCDAVDHAHQRGVVHRDLKPANVLVTEEGDLRVLDFGIARVADADRLTQSGRTDPGLLLGTLPYMSPEQLLSGPEAVDIRSDVYALGVLAYELLTGRRPLELGSVGLAEAARIVREQEPTTLGAHDRRLRGDVEVLVAKALAKDRDQRFGSAAEFAADLRRHLADRPIQARRQSTWRQVSKFARRHRGLVAGLAAAFAVLLVGTVTSTLLLLDKRDEARTAEEMTAFLESLFAEARPSGAEPLTLAEVAEAASVRIRDEFAERPLVRGRLLNLIGGTLNHLDRPDAARPLLEEALELRRAQFGERSLEVALTQERLALAHVRAGDERSLTAAEDLQREVLRLRSSLAPGTPLFVDACSNLAQTLRLSGGTEEAARLLDEAERTARDLGLQDGRLPGILLARAALSFQVGDYAGGEAFHRQALERFPETDPRGRAYAFLGLAEILRAQGRFDEALAVLREGLSETAERLAAGAEVLAKLRSTLANTLTDSGAIEQAVELHRALRAETAERYGPRSLAALTAQHDLAYALHERPDKSEAESTYREALAGFDTTLGADSGPSSMARHNLAVLLGQLGRTAEALDLELEALEARIARFGADDPVTLASWQGLGLLQEWHGDRAAAAETRRLTLEHTATRFGPDAPQTGWRQLELAASLRAAGQAADARSALLDLELRLAEAGDAPWRVELDAALRRERELLGAADGAGR